MNSDLISRKALLAEYDRQHEGEAGKARKLIEEAPAVEAEPKHGRWEDVPHHEDTIRCSNCKAYLPSCCEGDYCKNCGAKMDLEG